MLPEPGSPEDWLRYARSDLALARVSTDSDVLLESLCFHAQQAAEKAIKALLVWHRIDVPRTHDLGTLLNTLPGPDSIPVNVVACAILTEYGVSIRYPSPGEDVTQDDYDEAIRMAVSVLAWVEERLRLP